MLATRETGWPSAWSRPRMARPRTSGPVSSHWLRMKRDPTTLSRPPRTKMAPPPPPSVSSPVFTVSGYTYTQPSVARLMRRLRLVPWLSGVSLTTSSKTSLSDRVVYQFTLGANVIPLPEVGP